MSNPTDSSRWSDVRDTIQTTLADQDRSHDSLEVIAVTKGFPSDVLEASFEAGFDAFGENRVTEALEKKQQLPESLVSEADWHFIGHLQSNKVRKIIGEFDLIHSVDRMSLINEFHKRLEREDLSQDVLMQVNVSGEESKYGVSSDEASDLAGEITARATLNLQGLMTIAPWTDDEAVLRETFRRCRKLRDKIERDHDVDCQELSMGMTNDYTVAIEEGATMLRLGRALFGERPDG